MKKIALRFVAGAFLGCVALAIRQSIDHLYLLANLEPGLVVLFISTVVFGWMGLAGAASASAGVPLVLSAVPSTQPATGVAVVVIAAVYVALRSYERRLLTLERARVLIAVLGGMVLSGVTYGLTVSWLYFPAAYWTAAGIWTTASCVSLLVFGCPALMLARLLPSEWLVPEVEEVGSSRHPFGPPQGLWRWGWVALSLIVLSLAISLVVQQRPSSALWFGIVYLLPVYASVLIAPVGGGLLGAALGGTSYLLALSLASPVATGLEGHLRAADVSALLLVFWMLGVWLGRARHREVDLATQLETTNRLLRQDLERVVQALAGAVEAKDAYTEGHLRRVHDYAVDVGIELGLDAEELEALRVASVLHDVGKIGIPESILHKPTCLEPAEQTVMRRHPEIGARILDSIEGFSLAARLVRAHQERYDGRRDGLRPGYPDGLAGEAIPLGARIIAVVDAFDAMTTDRPYRSRLRYDEAVDELRQHAGSQFDPVVVETFLSKVDARQWEAEDREIAGQRRREG